MKMAEENLREDVRRLVNAHFPQSGDEKEKAIEEIYRIIRNRTSTKEKEVPLGYEWELP